MSPTTAVVREDDSAPLPDPSSEHGRDRRRRTRELAVFIVPTIIYLVLILAGATTSSIGIASLRQDPQHPIGIHLGGNQSIRSDEFGTGSPMVIGQIVRDGASATPPLSVPGDLFAQLPSGPVSSVVFFDGTALHLAPIVPAEMLFAMRWWLPAYLLFLGLPVLFRQITGRLRWGYLAAALLAVSPATAWWSGIPVNIVAFASAASALSVFGSRSLAKRQWVRAISAFIAAGILLARIPTYYQPTAIVVGLPIVAAAVVVIVTDPYRLRTRLTAIAAASVSSIAWTAALFWESRDAMAVGLATVYPGHRQSSGQALEPGFVFGATNLGWLRFQQVGDGSNQSEITTSFVALGAALVILLVLGRFAGGRRLRWIVLTLTIPALFWMSWCLIDWGAWSATIPLINRVPPSRAAMGAGYLAVIGFCLALAQYRPSGQRRAAVAASSGAAVGALSIWGGVSLDASGLLQDLAPWMIALSGATAGFVVFVLVYWPARVWPMVVAGVAAVAVTVTAQPLIFGLGDLHASSTARQLTAWGTASRADASLWASDSQSMDSLFTATAVPALSARQQIGPNRTQWRRLDPHGEHEAVWNRGGTHIAFEWAPTGIEFLQPFADTVVIRASPCTVHERIPAFRHVVSTHPLDERCLTEVARVAWSGRTQYVYDVVSLP